MSAVSVVEGNLVVSLAPTAVAMTAWGTKAEGPTQGSFSSYREWGSFNGLKSALGPAGPGRQWHHVVEQTPGNLERFGPEAIHNTVNVIPLDEALHTLVSAFYSKKNFRVTGSRELTVRQWLSTQSYEAQREFGLLVIENIKKGVW